MGRFGSRLILVILFSCIVAPAQAQVSPTKGPNAPAAEDNKKPVSNGYSERRTRKRRTRRRPIVSHSIVRLGKSAPWHLVEILGDQVKKSGVCLTYSKGLLKGFGKCGRFRYRFSEYSESESAWLAEAEEPQNARIFSCDSVRKMIWEEMGQVIQMTQRITQGDDRLNLHDSKGNAVAVLKRGSHNHCRSVRTRRSIRWPVLIDTNAPVQLGR